jgi:hypothetical protein
VMQVRTHSYSKEIAGVVEIKFVIGGRSLRTRRGSTGVRVANCGTVAMSSNCHFDAEPGGLPISQS